MSQVGKKYTLLLILCITVILAIFGCGSPNENSSFDPDGESHPNDWLPARHAAAALLDLGECTQCHGADFSFKTACTECHMESATQIHPAAWEDRVGVRHKGYVEDNGTARCSNVYCHGETLEGVTLSGPSCSSCHLGGPDSIHPKEWEPRTYVRHVPYVKDNGNGSCSNSACHGSDLSGVSESGPSCSRCHLGGPDSYHPRKWGSNRRMEVGFVRNDIWFLDFNDNKLIDFPDDKQFDLGVGSGIPVTGDWNRNGVDKAGMYNDGTWFIDFNGNGAWDGAPTDRIYVFGAGLVNAIPVSGDWTGTGMDKIGVYADGLWYLDMNGDGAWNGTPDDALYSFGGGLPNNIPMTGDWTGSGTSKIGVFSDGTWYIDQNGNGAWNGPIIDRMISFGSPGDIAVTGDWNGDLITDIGTFNDGNWIIDSNGNGNHDADSDETFTLGAPGDIPITGDWNRNAFVKLHGVYVGSDGGGSCANAACHGADFNGVLQSGPGCYICHGPGFTAPPIN